MTAFSAEVIAAVKDDLPAFDVSKGMIRFTPEQPIPEDVVREMVRLRLAELAPDRPSTAAGMRARKAALEGPPRAATPRPP